MRRILCILLTIVLSVAGCRVAVPNFRAPGHLYQQQLRATFNDPYPLPDAAPMVYGGRPRDYLVPRSQSVKSQWQLDSQPPN